MAVMLKQDYGQWKKGDVITPNGGMAERLIGQGKAVPVKAPPSQQQAAEIERDNLLPSSTDCTSLQMEALEEGAEKTEPAVRKRQKKETPSASYVGTSRRVEPGALERSENAEHRPSEARDGAEATEGG